jgi:HTH-type transcriptional regulator, glycine betaine synthesis regulator
VRGYVMLSEDGPDDDGRLRDWETLAVGAVGTVIEFWGFKRNHGRAWALLYLRGRAMTALEIQEELGLSKGAVSMITRELERWGIVTRVRSPNEEPWRFAAEQDLMKMLTGVLAEREASLVHRVRADLAEAERRARRDPRATKEHIARLRRMSALAEVVDGALGVFLKTFRLDARRLLGLLKTSVSHIGGGR